MEAQFDKYIANVQHDDGLSLDDFWQKYFGSKLKNCFPTSANIARTNTAFVATEIKLEDLVDAEYECDGFTDDRSIAYIATEVKMEDPMDIADEVDDSDSYDSASVYASSDYSEDVALDK